MEQLVLKTRELLNLGLWESAEILARVLAASPDHTSSNRAAYQALLGDALFGKAELETAEQHYREALQCHKMSVHSGEASLDSAARAQVQFQLAKCTASKNPRKAVFMLEAIPPQKRNAAMLCMLGDLYRRCGDAHKAQDTYKAALGKCPHAVEAAVAIAKLGGPPDCVVKMLLGGLDRKQVNGGDCPMDEELPSASANSGEVCPNARAAESLLPTTAAKPSTPQQAKSSPFAGEKRGRNGSESPDRKRRALNDRAALENASSPDCTIRTPPPVQMPPADENGNQIPVEEAGQEREASLHSPKGGPSTSSGRGTLDADWAQLLIQGCAAEAAHDSKLAVSSFALLVSQSPTNLYPLLRLASAHAAAGHAALAVELFERCRRLEPANTRQMDDYAMLLYHEGKLSELGQLAFSLASFGRHQSLPGSNAALGHGPPPSPESWVAASAYLALCGSSKEGCLPAWKEKALESIQQAFDLGVEHPALLFLKGELLSGSWETKSVTLEALAAYKASYKLKQDWRAMVGCAKASVWGGKGAEAVEYAKEAAKTRQPDALALLALLYWEIRGRQQEAMQAINEALKQDPDHVRSIATLAKLLCYDKRPEEACALLQTKLMTKPSDKLHFQLGAALRQMGRMKDAVLQFQAALGRNPDNQLAQKELSACEAQLKLRQAKQDASPAFECLGSRPSRMVEESEFDVRAKEKKAGGHSGDAVEGGSASAAPSGAIVLPYPQLFPSADNPRNPSARPGAIARFHAAADLLRRSPSPSAHLVTPRRPRSVDDWEFAEPEDFGADRRSRLGVEDLVGRAGFEATSVAYPEAGGLSRQRRQTQADLGSLQF